MKLYIMRHGAAAPASGFDLDADANRPLTDGGRDQVVEVITRRKHALREVELVLASPYLRARQTAQLAMAQLETMPQLLISDCLTPDVKPAAVLAFLDQLGASSILIASHMPLVARLLETLTTGNERRVMGTAWLAALDMEARRTGLDRKAARLTLLLKPL